MLAMSGVLLFFIGIGIYRFTIRPILKDPPLNQLLLTLGDLDFLSETLP